MFLPLDKKLWSPTIFFGWEFCQIYNLELIANGGLAWLVRTHLGSPAGVRWWVSTLVGPWAFKLSPLPGGWLTSIFFYPKKKKNLGVSYS